MNLKKLEIFGFKSFAQRTEVLFNGGITGIVGPNGSGKSNIGDAVKWVLGEQNPRELRGGSILADPWYKSENDNTCLYCDYFSACHFDGQREKWRRRKSMKAPEFWAGIDPANRAEEGAEHGTDA